MGLPLRLAAAFLIVCHAAPAARAATSWARTYGGTATDAPDEVALLPDGGMAIVGETRSFGPGALADLWVVRLDADGDVAWERSYGGPGDDRGTGIDVTPDGGLIVAGLTASFGADHDTLILKLDASGLPEWQVLDDGGRSELGPTVRSLAAGGYLVACNAGIPPQPQGIRLLRLDDAGAVTWRRELAGGGDDTFAIQDVAEVPGGGFVLAGRATTPQGRTDLWVARLEADGALRWQRAYGGSGDESANAVATTADGGLVVAGRTSTYGQGSLDLWVLKLRADGDVAWEVAYGESEAEQANAVVQTADGGYAVAGWTTSFGASQHDAWLLRLDATGDFAWQRRYGSVGADVGMALRQRADGGFVMTAETRSFSLGDVDAWVLRLEPDGRTVGACPWSADTSVTATRTRTRVSPADAISAAAIGTARDPALSPRVTTARVSEQCGLTPCARLACDAITVDVDPACAGTLRTFTATWSGGMLPLELEWDFDGDGIADAAGDVASAAIPEGDSLVRLTVVDGCAEPGPQVCALALPVTGLPPPSPLVLADGATSFCAAAGQSVTLDAGPGWASHRWRRDGVDVPGAVGATVIARESGTWDVVVTDAYGCPGASSPLVVDAGDCSASCDALRCLGTSVTPPSACAGATQDLLLDWDGGEGMVSVAWDVDGDTLDDAWGNPASVTLPAGTWILTATIRDSCTGPGPQSCSAQVVAEVADATPPGEVSDVLAGDRPLRIDPREGTLVIEPQAAAEAYNVYVAPIGAWYAPGMARRCALRSYLDVGDGTIALSHDVPAGHWVLVTASTACAEGPAGPDSLGLERMTLGAWPACGP